MAYDGSFVKGNDFYDAIWDHLRYAILSVLLISNEDGRLTTSSSILFGFDFHQTENWTKITELANFF